MAVDSIDDMLRRKYDSHIAFHMYNANFPPEDIMLFVAPLIHILATTRFRHVHSEDLEDAKSEAFMDLLHYFDRSNSEFREEKMFHYKCWWIVFRAFRRQLQFNKQQELNTDDLDFSRLPHPQDFDRVHWMSHVEEEIRAMALGQVRFSGPAFGACEYIVRALLDNREPKTTVIERDFGLTHASFYIDYMRILLRKSLYDIKDNPNTYDTLLRELVPSIAAPSVLDESGRFD